METVATMIKEIKYSKSKSIIKKKKNDDILILKMVILRFIKYV